MDPVVVSTGSVADLSSWACRALLPLSGKWAGICYQGPNLPHLFLALNLYSRETKMEKEGKGQNQLGLSLFIRKAKAFSECHPSIQLSSGAQSCLTLCDPKDYCMLGFPVYHQLPKLAQTRVHQVGVAIQPSHPLSYPSPPAFNLSQHQGLCQ